MSDPRGVSMAANPAVVTAQGIPAPAPFPGESLVLRRDNVEFVIDGLRTQSGKWLAKGTLWLSDVRLVVIASGAARSDGLVAFDFPLAYITHNKFNQPVFGCNHLSGKVWPAAEGGGPSGTLAPHDYKIWFPRGGVGTLLPLFYRFISEARAALQQRSAQQHSTGQHGFAQYSTSAAPSAPPLPAALVATALVDPADPSQIFLTQPVDDSMRLSSAPVYASNYGADEKYEAM